MATVPAPVPAAESQAAISPIGRIFGVLFSPKPTFEDIARKPSWILPVILTTVLSIIAVIALNQRMNWREYISDQLEKNPKAAQMSAEQKEKQVDISAKVTVYVVYAVGALAPIVMAVLIGAILMGAYNLLGGAGASFSQSIAIAAHSGLVGLISTPIFLLVLFLRPAGTIDPENPVVTNLAAFLPEESAKWLVTLCKSLDIFTIWTLILIAIGFAAVNPRKLKGAKSFVIVFGLWGAFVLVRTMWAFIVS
jgi:Yip1-like protein